MYVCPSHFNCCVGNEHFRGCSLHFRLRMLAKPPCRFVHRHLWSQPIILILNRVLLDFVCRHLWSQPIILILNGVLLDFINESKGPLPLKRVRQRLEKLIEKGHEYVDSRNLAATGIYGNIYIFFTRNYAYGMLLLLFLHSRQRRLHALHQSAQQHRNAELADQYLRTQ